MESEGKVFSVKLFEQQTWATKDTKEKGKNVAQKTLHQMQDALEKDKNVAQKTLHQIQDFRAQLVVDNEKENLEEQKTTSSHDTPHPTHGIKVK